MNFSRRRCIQIRRCRNNIWYAKIKVRKIRKIGACLPGKKWKFKIFSDFMAKAPSRMRKKLQVSEYFNGRQKNPTQTFFLTKNKTKFYLSPKIHLCPGRRVETTTGGLRDSEEDIHWRYRRRHYLLKENFGKILKKLPKKIK